MMIAAVLVAVLVAYLAFRFVTGMIKFGLIAVVLLVAYLVAHQAGVV